MYAINRCIVHSNRVEINVYRKSVCKRLFFFNRQQYACTFWIFFFFFWAGKSYSSKVDSERQIFWEIFHGNFYLLLEFLPEICWKEIAEEILFVFCFDVWPGARTTYTTYKTTANYNIASNIELLRKLLRKFTIYVDLIWRY